MAHIHPDAVPVGTQGKKIRLTDPRELGRVQSVMKSTGKLFPNMATLRAFITTNGFNTDHMVVPPPEFQTYCSP